MNIFSIRHICFVLSLVLFTLTEFSPKLLCGTTKKAETTILPLVGEIGQIIQEHMIDPHYAKPLPSPSKVKVSFRGEKRLWTNLTREQKIEVNNHKTLPHNQLSKNSKEDAVDKHFMPDNQKIFLATDPRQFHGCDHAVRMAIIGPLFAYLYQKHRLGHKDVLSQNLLRFIQFVGAAHDCGRQTEGPDVYDKDSASYAKEALRNLGVTDNKSLEQCREAIEEKDSPPTATKGFVAKCVQNADSAEFARLLLSSPIQDPVGFEHSRGYLDIYKEMEQLYRDGKVDEKQFADFKKELDALRVELNRFIFLTHTKEFREKASKKGKCYFDEILYTINQSTFPLLYKILSESGIKKERASSIAIEPSYIIPCVKSSLDILPTETLKEFVEHLKRASFQDPVIKTVKNEIKGRKEAESRFYTTLEQKDAVLIEQAFSRLPFTSREKLRLDLQEYLTTLKLETARVPDILVDEQQYQRVSDLLRFETDPEVLFEEAIGLLECIKVRPDPMKQTAIAKAFEKSALLFIQTGNRERAEAVLYSAQENLTVSEIHPLYKLFTSKLLSQDSPVFISTGCDSIRRRQMEVSKKRIDGESTLELSFELTVSARNQFEQFFTSGFFDQVESVPFEFIEKSSKGFSSSNSIEIDNAYKIHLSKNVEMFIGNNSKYWNAYHHVRIRCKSRTSLQEIHRAFAALGLPTALMVSREEDRKKECLARILHLRFPQKSLLGDHVDPYKIYNALSEKERKKVENDLAKMKCTLVGPHHLEYVLPAFARELRKAGGVCLGSYISAGEISNTANVLVSTLQKGLLSCQARLQRGILGRGTCPTWNYEAGSGNQVFTRLFTSKQFISEYRLAKFPVRGNILILFDLQAMERIPYFYLHDRVGVRNPYYSKPTQYAQKQKPIKNFRGHKEIALRPTPEEFVAKQEESPHPLNEVLFDQTLGPQYIRKIVLETDEDRKVVLGVLRKNKIPNINGIPIEEAVEVLSRLNSKLGNNI